MSIKLVATNQLSKPTAVPPGFNMSFIAATNKYTLVNLLVAIIVNAAHTRDSSFVCLVVRSCEFGFAAEFMIGLNCCTTCFWLALSSQLILNS